MNSLIYNYKFIAYLELVFLGCDKNSEDHVI